LNIIAKHWKEILTTCLNSGVSFAVYREPGSLRGKIIIQSDYHDREKKKFSISDCKGFVFIPFETTRLNKKILIRGDVIAFSDEILPGTVKIAETRIPYKTRKCNLHFADAEEYCDQVETAVDNMKTSPLKKVVLSRIQKQTKPEDFDVLDFFENICGTLPDAFCYVCFHPSAGLWCGASPELLMKFDGNSIETVSLAGTRAMENKTPVEVHWNDKEITEQQLVSDYILEILKGSDIKELSIQGPFTARAGNLVHLKTTFRSIVEESFNYQHLADILHPTPAVCGLPKALAMNFIGQTENHSRNYYAGYAGPVNIDIPALFHVNLRCMQVFDDTLALYVGAGITIDSDPLSEWKETCHKATTLIKILEKDKK